MTGSEPRRGVKIRLTDSEIRDAKQVAAENGRTFNMEIVLALRNWLAMYRHKEQTST